MQRKTSLDKIPKHLASYETSLYLALVVLLSLSSSIWGADKAKYVEGELLIKFKEGTYEEEIAAFEIQHNLQRVKIFQHLGIVQYQILNGQHTEVVKDNCSSEEIVEFVELNLIRSLNSSSDPRFGDQWSLNNTGQTVNGIQGTAGIDINWLEAMDIFDPQEDVIVAVIDTGVEFTHPEFLTIISESVVDFSIFFNIGEAEAENGIDDDGNGFIDDAFGWDFFDDDALPLDEHGHGTLVASIIAALNNNDIGGTGVSPTAIILPLRGFDDFGEGLTTTIFVESTTYAASMGARVINASYGRPTFNTVEQLQVSWLEDQDILLIAAAGNGGTDSQGDDNDIIPFYPASYSGENVISVAAIDQNGDLANFSNFGATSVDIAAPGVNIFGADVSRTIQYAERFETEAPGWISGAAPENESIFSWSLFTDNLGNTWLTDSDFLGLQVDYQPFTYTYAQSPAIDLAGYIGPQLTFDLFHDLNLLFDLFGVEASTDLINWFTKTSFDRRGRALANHSS